VQFAGNHGVGHDDCARSVVSVAGSLDAAGALAGAATRIDFAEDELCGACANAHHTMTQPKLRRKRFWSSHSP